MKVFVSYAASGAGHQIAAVSLHQAVKTLRPGVEVEIFDALDYTTPLFRVSYPRIYLFLIRRFPRLWGFFYYLTDSRYLSWPIAKIRSFVNYLNSRRLIAYLREEEPDVLISTHFFLPQVAGRLKKKGAKFRLVSVITDFRLHRFWYEPQVDCFIGASPETARDLLEYGIDEERIKILGIPVRPVFAQEKKREALVRKFNLKEGYFNVLIVSGGFGVGPIEKLVAALGRSEERIQLLVVAGRNDELYRRLKLLAREVANPVQIYGFVENMDELMTCSDVLVSKPGGLTTAEALARELPMIIIAPVPGQESRNAGLLLKHKVGRCCDTVSEARGAVETLSRSPEAIADMKKNIAPLSRPRAAFDIIEELL